LRVGLLGAGRIGTFHARVLAAHPDVDSLLISDADLPRAEALAGEIGATAATIEDAVRSGLDAAVIAAATTAHAELINTCLDAHVPTFCEKPIALDYEETLAVVDRVESSGAVLQMGFQRRFDAGYREARRMIETGELGTLYSLRLATHDPEPPHEAYIPQSGGIFRDLHIHDFDILRWLAGSEAAEVYAQGSVRRFDVFAKYGDVDTSAALIRMDDGVLAVLTGGRQDPLGYDVRTEIFGSGDSISVGLDQRTPLRSVEAGIDAPADTPYASFNVRFGEAYRAELWHFLDLARGRAENPCTARDALEALRIALCADISLEQHRPVLLSEITTQRA
jgi:myo-inositol 2-dehydrogenase / D-chiro-inositol 1-dehydrogenase